MSHESSPQQAGQPKGLLQQMEEMMAALNADLSQLDADLSTPATESPEGDRQPPAPVTPVTPADGAADRPH